MPDDLNEVIQKADEARAEREKQHQHTGLQLRHTKHLRQLRAVHDPDDAQRGQNAQNKAEAAHGGGAVFLAVPCGALLVDGLAKVQPVQRRDHEFARHRVMAKPPTAAAASRDEICSMPLIPPNVCWGAYPCGNSL